MAEIVDTKGCIPCSIKTNGTLSQWLWAEIESVTCDSAAALLVTLVTLGVLLSSPNTLSILRRASTTATLSSSSMSYVPESLTASVVSSARHRVGIFDSPACSEPRTAARFEKSMATHGRREGLSLEGKEFSALLSQLKQFPKQINY